MIERVVLHQSAIHTHESDRRHDVREVTILDDDAPRFIARIRRPHVIGPRASADIHAASAGTDETATADGDAGASAFRLHAVRLHRKRGIMLEHAALDRPVVAPYHVDPGASVAPSLHTAIRDR